MKVFISSGMFSKDIEEIEKERDDIFQTVLRKFPDALLINSAIETGIDPDDDPNNLAVWRLGRSIQTLAFADIMVVSDDFTKYRGCNVERFVASAYDIPCYSLYQLKQLPDKS